MQLPCEAMMIAGRTANHGAPSRAIGVTRARSRATTVWPSLRHQVTSRPRWWPSWPWCYHAGLVPRCRLDRALALLTRTTATNTAVGGARPFCTPHRRWSPSQYPRRGLLIGEADTSKVTLSAAPRSPTRHHWAGLRTGRKCPLCMKSRPFRSIRTKEPKPDLTN